MTEAVAKHTIELCDCYEEDQRGVVGAMYEVDKWARVRCTECGNIPPEILAQKRDWVDMVELKIYQRLDEVTTRTFQEMHRVPDDG